MLSRLRFSSEEQKHITALVRHHLICYDGSWSDAAVRRWLRRVSPDLTSDLYALARADVLAKGREVSQDLARLDALKAHAERVVAAGAVLGVRDLAVDGGALMRELGLPPGRQIGELLRALLEEVLEAPQLNERQALLDRARALLSERK
jgi:tRNA nucleotidyltransferase (CCA-adding enzyme)